MNSTLRASLNFFFQTIPIKEFPAPAGGKCVTLSSETTVLESVQTLSTNNILAAPVVNTDASNPKKYLGIVDMIGIACFLLDNVQEHHSLDSLQKHDVLQTRLCDVKDPNFWAPFVPLRVEDSLLDAMLVMGKYGVHRVPVVSAEGIIINIITQSAVVNAIAKNLDQFEEVAGLTLEQLGLADHRTCVTVTIDDTLHIAIRAIRDNRVSAVPVLGFGQSLVGNVSARDLRQLILNPALFRLISHPVRQFLSTVSMVEREDMQPAISCRPKDTFGHVIRQLAVSKIHRTYVCDGSGRLLRIISLTDVIDKFVTNPAEDFVDTLDD